MKDFVSQSEIPARDVIARGKTKIISLTERPDTVDLFSMNTLTAGDGKKFNVIVGKGATCNEVACRVFELMRNRSVPVAYYGPNGERSFLAPRCKMLPYEVVVRFAADGSYLKRNHNVRRGTRCEVPIVEFYLKTSGRRWGDIELPCDDPLITEHHGAFALWRPSKVLSMQEPIVLKDLPGQEHIAAMRALVLKASLILRDEFYRQRADLIDLKWECGLDRRGWLLLADVMTPDEWRLQVCGVDLSKQFFRDHYQDWRDDEELLRRYRWARDITRNFPIR